MAALLIRQERLSDCLAEATELMRLHWEEVCADKERLKLDPDIGMYLQLEGMRRTVLATARDGGRLVGYLLFLLSPHPHYRRVLTAQEDLHFLHPGYRKGLAGARLIGRAVDMAKARGATLVTLRCKVAHNHGAIFERLGFAATDVVYTKALT